MADFNQAVQKTLIHEGGYVNNPNDSGGPTKYGITQADMPGVNISDITPEQAVAYYSEHYWKALYSQINSQPIAEKIFDMGVLFGVGTAVGLLQLSLNIVVDHVFGPNTLFAVNQADPAALLATYKTNLVTHTFNVATANSQDRVFLKGWANRINS
jgi:lysozyme family protein